MDNEQTEIQKVDDDEIDFSSTAILSVAEIVLFIFTGYFLACAKFTQQEFYILIALVTVILGIIIGIKVSIEIEERLKGGMKLNGLERENEEDK